MVGKHRVVTLILTVVAAGVIGVKFSIDAQVDQIFRIIEKAQMVVETSDMKMVMTPADFNFLVPFTVKMSCSNGLMIVHDMKRIHQEDIYMDAINDNETHISARFTVSEMDFKYELCWLSLIIPVPMWLRGKIWQSTYHIKSKLSYDPTCSFTITKASLESYEKMSLNVFNWLPGGLGDAMTEMLTKNLQDRIYETVSKSIEKTLTKLSTVYDACVAFPAMGRLKELPESPDEIEEESEETDDPLLAVVERDEVEPSELKSEDKSQASIQVQNIEQIETTKTQPVQYSQHPRYYDTVRSHILAEESRKKASLRDGRDRIEYGFKSTGGGNMKSTENPVQEDLEMEHKAVKKCGSGTETKDKRPNDKRSFDEFSCKQKRFPMSLLEYMENAGKCYKCQYKAESVGNVEKVIDENNKKAYVEDAAKHKFISETVKKSKTFSRTASGSVQNKIEL